MILQKILFPHQNICNEETLYFRPKNCLITDDAKRETERLIRQKEKEESLSGGSFLSVVFSGMPDNTGRGVSFSDIYAACGNDSAATADAVIFTERDQKVTLDTYFNSFSVFKWKKYTRLGNLSVCLDLIGDFRVEINNVIRRELKNEISEVWSEEITASERTKKVIDIPFEEINAGLVYVRIISKSDAGAFFGGEYITDPGENEDRIISPVKIAIAMCTYKREKYVEKNVHELSAFLMENENSPLHGNLELFIADNSQSLDAERLANENVHIYPNKNLGGAGGFGRAMYEILKVKEEKDFTNIIMMDDDVKFDPNVFERLFAFLSLQKDEYKEAHIGGAMLELDRMWMQSESGEYWYPKGHRAVKYMYDLRDIKWLLKNEIEDSVDNFGWWFCCMPISVLKRDNLPMPVFIKRDDIEYGLRNGRQFINIGGISVWHEAFDAKRTPFLDYYYYRNPLILNSGHRTSFNLMEMLDYYDDMRAVIDNDVNLYRYREAHIKLQGIDDFLKGIDWLLNQDAEVLNQTIMKRWAYAEKYMEDVNAIFVHGVWEKAAGFKESKAEEKERIKNGNGWNGPPTKGTVTVPMKNPPLGVVCGANKVIYYDEISQKGFVTYRSYAQRDAVYKHYEMTRNNLIENYERVRNEYHERFRELTDISFWDNYLFGEPKNKAVPVEWWEKIEEIPYQRRLAAEEKLEQCKLEISEQRKRIADYPIVRNRVVFYLYKRRGFTCNVKYILKKLHEDYGDRLEIIWISDYPESCGEVEALGIPVVKAGTKKHWEYYFTARVNVTSDCQPAHFLKRDDQVAITAWHGGISYKIIGYDCLAYSTDEELELYGLSNKQPDIWLSGSRRFTDDTAAGFRHDKKSFKPTGMARNDVFFSDRKKLVRDLKKKLGIKEGVKIAMYAPTFRRGGKAGSGVFNVRKFRKALTERWGGEWEILYRGHYFIRNNPNIEAIDVSQYDDMQELLLISDVLVSDYSSCMWDYTFTKRPIFVYAPDIDDYIYSDRGFFIPPDEWPFSIAVNTDELCDNIVNFDEKEFNKKIAAHQKEQGSYEKGTSTEAACKLITEACGI